MSRRDGVILWEGKSRIDGAPIVAIATALTGKSSNKKTGDMVQTWIMRTDVDPGDAIRTGQDESVCGSCVHRVVGGMGSCYVHAWALMGVWKKYKRGGYPDWDGTPFAKHVRIGSYGDPVAVPVRLWRDVMGRALRGHTGYTHQWGHKRANAYRSFLMASVETLDEEMLARGRGWRTFRVMPRTSRIPPNRVWCPSDELNPQSTPCAECLLCSGAEGRGDKSVAIFAHGSAKDTFGHRTPNANAPVERNGAMDDEVFVRILRPLHGECKQAAKDAGQHLKYWVRDALQEKLNNQKGSNNGNQRDHSNNPRSKSRKGKRLEGRNNN